MMRLIQKHPLPVRILHWANVPLLGVMIWSGLLIYWAGSNDQYSGGVYRIGWGETTLFHFFPKAFWEKTGLGHRLAEGMAYHFLFMWLFALNGLIYVGYTIASGRWRELLPDRHCWRDAFLVVLHDLHLRKMLPPAGRYNAAQRIAYTMIILMGGASLLTGLAIYRPVQLRWLTASLGGYEWARWEHFFLRLSMSNR